MLTPTRRPFGTPRFVVILAFALIALVAGACDSAVTAEPRTPTPDAEASTPAADATPRVTADPASGPTDSPAPLIPASEAPGQPGSAATGPVPSDACSGSTDNQGFFAVAASSLSWQVYCASLPDGWLVQSGSYRLGNGGSLKVAYAGPDGTRFELRQGAICADDSSCAPSGEDLGIIPFGDREARLLAWNGGGYAAMVDGGAPLSWVAYGPGLDEATFRGLIAGLLPVAGSQVP